ncbi:MAG: hypothetical protein N0C90_19055 [Candidatus Thiodiazotropha endolucinida]|nr:hypothetical protein [Candidatus Thiodiazotropha taylori]MCW4263455.1 hypothetical protein [Candidatus Thiodiazotropha endolucinida]
MKSNFTRSLNKLLMLLEEQDLPSRNEVKQAWKKLDCCMEIVLEVLSNFSDFYMKNKEYLKCKNIICEMEKIEDDYNTANDRTREYMDSRDDNSSLTSNVLSIDLQQRMNLTDSYLETSHTIPTVQPRTFSKVTLSKESMPVTINNERYGSSPIDTCTNMHNAKWPNIAQACQHNSEEQQTGPVLYQRDNERDMKFNTAPFETRAPAAMSGMSAGYDAPSIGQDLWRQLKRVQIPVFS